MECRFGGGTVASWFVHSTLDQASSLGSVVVIVLCSLVCDWSLTCNSPSLLVVREYKIMSTGKLSTKATPDKLLDVSCSGLASNVGEWWYSYVFKSLHATYNRVKRQGSFMNLLPQFCLYRPCWVWSKLVRHMQGWCSARTTLLPSLLIEHLNCWSMKLNFVWISL